ncbi:MAG: cytochrome c oxidase accessory protein CcoG [bacterium]|nr:cytochrome c oxidase accessory protein CcoG [bacterium]
MAQTSTRERSAYEENFRDHLGNVTPDGKRLKIHPRKPRGAYHRARVLVSWVLLVILFGGPFVTINGHPLLLLNIIERKFVLFGVPFWPQDFHLFLLVTLTFVVFIVLFTAIFGRLWCGWACPQTIFLEMVFRKIEYFIEGDAVQQRRLDKAPWTADKMMRKGLKHGIYAGLSFLIANTFLAYIIGIDELWVIVTDPPSQHLAGLGSITVFSLLFYGVFARFREQACIIVCPYGRWQSVMVNQDTIAVTYDFQRGEPRGKARKAGKEVEGLGDCVECRQCVQVCPTGIDIRNGIQMECVNCTACIDACDEVMDRVDRPKGLIRYSSFRSIEGGHRRLVTPRTLGYAGVLLVLLITAVSLFGTRDEVQAVILREPGRLYNELPDGRLSNFYSVKIINKTFSTLPIELRLESPAEGELTYLGTLGPVAPQGIVEGRFYVALPGKLLQPGRNDIVFSLWSGATLVHRLESSFLAPHDVGTR